MSQNRTILIVIAVLLVGILGIMVANSQRTPSDKIGDGMHEIGQGVSDAVHHATH